jgi:hypothetical protein
MLYPINQLLIFIYIHGHWGGKGTMCAPFGILQCNIVLLPLLLGTSCEMLLMKGSFFRLESAEITLKTSIYLTLFLRQKGFLKFFNRIIQILISRLLRINPVGIFVEEVLESCPQRVSKFSTAEYCNSSAR